MTTIEDTPLGLAHSYLESFLCVSDAQRLHMTLWAAATRIYRIFPAFARLDFSASGPGCGKTNALEVVCSLCPEPVVVAYTTPAAIKGWFDEHPESTFGLDERDGLMGTTGRATGGRAEIVSVLNGGYAANGKAMCTRGGKSVLMPVYNAVAHAGIGRAYPALSDRSVTITLDKASPAETWVSILHEQEMYAVGTDINRWLSGDAEQKALRAAPPRRLDLQGDPRHQLMMAPMAAVASLAGILSDFIAADAEIRSGMRRNPLPSRAEMLLRSLADYAGERMTSEDIKAALPGQFIDGRIGDITIAGLLREVGIESAASNGARGYVIPTTDSKHTETAHRTLKTQNTCAASAIADQYACLSDD